MSDLVAPSRVILDAPTVVDFILSRERERILQELADHVAVACFYGEGVARAVYGIGLLMRGRWPL